MSPATCCLGSLRSRSPSVSYWPRCSPPHNDGEPEGENESKGASWLVAGDPQEEAVGDPETGEPDGDPETGEPEGYSGAGEPDGDS